MNRPSVLGQKEDRNLQLEIEFKSEFKNYILHLLSMSVRHYSSIPLKLLSLQVQNFRSCGESTFQNSYDCVQFFILSKSMNCPFDIFFEFCNSPRKKHPQRLIRISFKHFSNFFIEGNSIFPRAVPYFFKGGNWIFFIKIEVFLNKINASCNQAACKLGFYFSSVLAIKKYNNYFKN